MTEKKPMVVYAATYDSVSAAETDLDAIEQLHKDIAGSYEAGGVPVRIARVTAGKADIALVTAGSWSGLATRRQVPAGQPERLVAGPGK